MKLVVEDSKAHGTLNMAGQERPIDVELGGAIFSDGAGAHEALAARALSEGFTATYRTLDLMRQKEKLLKLVVGAVESVTVPAGTFDAWRVEITPAGGDPGRTEVWIARDTRQVVKTSAVVPELGGGTVTSELMP